MPVTKRGRSWQGAVTIDGTRFRKSFKSEAEAHQWVRESEARSVLGQAPLTGRIGGQTLQDAYQATVDDVWVHRKAFVELDSQGRHVLRVLGGDRRLESIDSTAVRALVGHYKDRGASNGTINRKLAALSKMMKHAHKCGMIHTVPPIPKLPERQGRIRFLTLDEERELIRQFRHHGRVPYAQLCLFLVDTGCRVSEALRVEWKDINHDPDGSSVTIWESKNGSSRTVPLTDRVVSMLKEIDRHLAGDGPFRRINQNSFNHEWTLIRRHMGLHDDSQFVPHALRHTYASRLVQNGVEILTVKELLGHRTLSVTLRYSHLAPKTLRSAVAKLNNVVGQE